MSKLSQLKQEAYQAGKKREWDRAVSIYDQILEIDKNNPMVINEMGDLCLKAGDTPRSLRYFLSAASRYRTTGLFNNAVAIYKKVLRYDPDNQTAHWYLAETRAAQGLLVEGEDHAIRFLENSERVSGDLKEIFLKRCGQLFDLYSESKPILDKLLLIFRMWEMSLESARTSCLLACFSWEAGEEDEAREAIKDILAKAPQVQNYPEFQRLSGLIDPSLTAGGLESADVNSISLGEDESSFSGLASESTEIIEETADPEEPEVQENPEVLDSSETLPASEAPEGAEVQETPIIPENDDIEDLTQVSEEESSELSVELDEEGCFDLGMDQESGSFEDLMVRAVSDLDSVNDSAEEVSSPDDSVPADSDVTKEPKLEAGRVDLLAQILAEDDGDLSGNVDSQLETIAQDIGTQVGGEEGDQDPASLYEMGMVYLEMGLFDQAVDSFRKAAADLEFAARSYEMWGITLLKAQRSHEAIEALELGLETMDKGGKSTLGLMYYLAQAYESSDQNDRAVAQYQEIQRIDPGFLDVHDRLSVLVGT
ncbi:MAG: tetratricopeptide repeat protein [Gemmatimonadales bacterium]|nr:tetratricopeptide repeat protein [Gemmatimonadales bacterium]